MSSNRNRAILEAVSKAAHRPAVAAKTATVAEREPARAADKEGPDYYVAPSREGKLHMSAWLDPAFKGSLRAIQQKAPEKSFQDLYVEALNDLFEKYKVPVVHVEPPSRSRRGSR